MRKYLLLTVFGLMIVTIFAFSSETVLAQTFPDPLGGADITDIVRRLITAALGLVGGLFFVMFLWGGFQYMTAGGDGAQVKSARTVLSNAVIGIIIVGVSYALVASIITALDKGTQPPPSSQPSGPPAVPVTPDP